jgi:lauroyl/myristoyl acyltransferase
MRNKASQSRLLLVLAWILALGAAAVLLFVRRLPLFLRLETGLGNLIAAAALWLYRRQNFPPAE